MKLSYAQVGAVNFTSSRWKALKKLKGFGFVWGFFPSEGINEKCTY